MADSLMALAARCGVIASYTDQTRRRRRTGRATARALLAAMGVSAGTEAEASEALAALAADAEARSVPRWRIAEPGAAIPLDGLGGAEWQLVCEDGTKHEGTGPTLPALPLGLHELIVGAAICTLIVSPRRLSLPPRTWGVMLPLHALRPPDVGGLADYGDLARAAEGLATLGADFVGLNPIHAGFTTDPSHFSPYTPSHRRRLSTFHIPDGSTPRPNGPHVDFAADIPRRRAALEMLFREAQKAGLDPAFAAFREREGTALERFALHQALSERHGAHWTDWPVALRDPKGPAACAAAVDLAEAVTFHAWLQWRAQEELRTANDRAHRAGMGLGLYLDLAVGTHPAGAETWEDRGSFAYDVSLGAPPDAFSADGQSWGLAPFNPLSLITQGFRPLAETLRRQMALSGMVRIDHILGFDRAFWVPEAGAPGAYIRMPREAMLGVLRLEAARANAVVVGEDLGNVPRGLRQALDASGILGCSVLMFGRDEAKGAGFPDPREATARAIASFSTHDLPTWRGWRAGRDIAARARLGHMAERPTAAARADRADDVAAFDAMTRTFRAPEADPASADAMHAALTVSGAALAMVQIENALDLPDQPNLPGTVDEYPNWRQRLPVGPEGMSGDPGLLRASRIMNVRKQSEPGD